MKKTLSIALIAAMALGLAACGSSSSSSSTESNVESTTESTVASSGDFTTVEEGELHMATNAAFPPYEMTTDDGGFEGIDVEVAGKIAEKLGLTLVVDDMDFSSVITSVQSGKEDIANKSITCIFIPTHVTISLRIM